MGTLLPEDKLVLEALADANDCPEIARAVYIWVYGEVADLKIVSQRLADANWSLTDVVESEDGRLMINAERIQKTSEPEIIKMSAEIGRLISGTGADYDGWETSVETIS